MKSKRKHSLESSDDLASLLGAGDLSDLLGARTSILEATAKNSITDLLPAGDGDNAEPANPLDAVATTGTLEVDAEAEVSAILTAFKDRREEEIRRQRDQLDPEFWVCMVFWSRRDCEEFITKVGVGKHTQKYLDGYEVAQKFGFNVEMTAPEGASRARVD